MFKGFAKVWTPLVEARAVADKPLHVEVAGEGLVLFRGEGGRIGALVDRCPHRGVRLSLGQVGRDGCLECPFHGWRFATDGANRGVPLNPDAKLGQLAATPVPVRVLGDLVWIYTAPGLEAPHEPTAPEGLIRPDLSRTYISRVWASHWTRAMENMLDSPHLPFVHRRTIGKPLLRRMTPSSQMDVTWEDQPWGGRSSARLDGVDGGGVLEFFRPNVMSLTIPIPGRYFRIHALVIPVGETQTRLMVATSRDFVRMGALNFAFRMSSARIADEDKAVVESSPTGEIPKAGDELSVRTDRATLQFRKYYHEVLAGSAS